MKSLKRQRGFFLNPYRFAGTTQSGAFSVTGESTPTMAGAAVSTMALSSIAEGDAIWDTGQATSGAFSAVAESVATMEGAARADGRVSSSAEGDATFVSQAAEAVVDAADFDGTNDWLSKTTVYSPAPSSSTKTGIFSCWLMLDALGSTQTIFDFRVGSSYRTQVVVSSSNLGECNVSSDGGTNFALQMRTSSALTTATWYHILMSWDAATGAEHLYVNGTSDISVITNNNLAIDYSGVNNTFVGAIDSAGSFKLNGGLAEVYFAADQYLDFSVQANREKFRTAGGKPVSLGTTGSVPTGTVPTFYLHLDDAETANNFSVNRAGSGNLTVTGALTTRASSPSD